VSVFVDTSALFTLVDADSEEHHAATEEWDRLRRDATRLRTHNYVVLETASLLQRRLGMDAVAHLHRYLLPVLSVRFVAPDLHTLAMTSLLAAGRRKVSLVDWTSFEMMRDEHLTEAFTFDRHFAEQGFTLRPAR
jgi:uncharacterized protein